MAGTGAAPRQLIQGGTSCYKRYALLPEAKMRKISTILLAVWALTWGSAMAAEVNYYDLLSTDRVGARDFVSRHSNWDGRGTVVAVLDTGVDMSAAGLLRTSAGEIKVIEARDFSGQGIVHLRAPTQAKEGEELVWKTGKGVIRGVDRLTPVPLAKSLLVGVGAVRYILCMEDNGIQLSHA